MRIIVTIFVFLAVNIAFSQENKVYVEYEIINLSVGKPIYVKAKLLINNNKSLYVINPKDTKYNKNEKAVFDEKENSVKRVIYRSSKNNFYLLTDRTKNLIEQTSGSEDYRFIVTEKIHSFKWTITDETKLIGKFTCKKATTYFRGRNYMAWFSPEIPLNSGPWKFSGLPGLILEVKDTESLFAWKTKVIKLPYNDNVKLDIPNEKKLKKVKLEDYVAMKSKGSQNYSSLIKSKMPKGTKFRDMKIRRQGIELVYEWEE
ncbi:GLPGLI family protein [Polaribacter sp. M15]